MDGDGCPAAAAARAPEHRGPPARRTARPASRALRNLVQEAGDALDAAVLAQHGKIRALDRAVGAVRAEAPGEADMFAKAVGLADQCELEIGEFLLNARDQRVDPVMAVA